MAKDTVAALIIAAGYSSRMHDFKPLLSFEKTNAIKRLVQTYETFGIEHIYVVVGYLKEEIIATLRGYNVHIVYNEAFDQGMFSSIQKGIKAMDETVEAFYMNPVDIPLIKTQTLERLYEAYVREKKGIVYPVFLGRKGHPPLIDRKYQNAILSSKGEGGLKNVLETLEHDALHVDVCDQSILMDMDEKEDYFALLRYDAMKVPTKEECLAIMRLNDVPEPVIQHCEAVGKTVLALLNEISLCHLVFDKNALLAAAYLHDIARQEKDHATRGAEKLRAMGYETIGDMIATHMDITVDRTAPLSANELLFLADKLVCETEVCGYEKRFEKALKKCEGNLEAQRHIAQRLEAVKMIIAKIEQCTCKVFAYG